VSALPEPNPPKSERDVAWLGRAIALVVVFNKCALKTNDGKSRRQTRARTPSIVNTEIMHGLERFCVTMSADPSTWIVTVFEATSYKAPPRLTSLFSPKWKTYYDDRFGTTFQTAANLNSSQSVKKFRPFHDLYDGAEMAKRNYRARGQEHLCLRAADVTYGFHTGSAQCVDCPQKSACVVLTAQLMKEYYA